jgi:O-succinylbenzoate synthase
VRTVREKFPDIMLMVDANGDYQLTDAAEGLQQLDAFNLMMIEQPLSYFDIYQHSILQRALKTPLCLDESIHSLDDAAAAIALGSCRILNIKQGRVGGLLEARRMARLAADHDIGVWSGGMDETGIGRAVNIHLQADKNFNLPGDTSETSRYFHEDIVEPPVVLDSNGFIDIPAGSGSGVKILPKILSKYTIHQERIK